MICHVKTVIGMMNVDTSSGPENLYIERWAVLQETFPGKEVGLCILDISRTGKGETPKTNI